MRGIKNIIARRRPDTGHEFGPDPFGTLDEPAARDDITSCEPDDSVPLSECDIATARAARNHVPRPERPQPMIRRGQMRPSQPAHEPVVATYDPSDGTPPETAPVVPSRPKIWDLDPPQDSAAAQPPDAAPTPAPSADETDDASALARSAAAAPRSPSKGAERVKTRMLGFHAAPAGPDPLAAPAAEATGAAPRFPIGWLVVLDGPGRGASFTLTAGLSTVGRDADQTVTLDFGDTSVSRERHVSIAYDDEENRTYIGHGGKANIVRLNDKPLLSTEELQDGDTIRVGKTVLRFVGFCSPEFSWSAADADGSADD